MRFLRHGCLLLLAAFAAVAGIGCDGKDPDRLQKVARKLNEKARKSTEDVNLPRITITMPERKKDVNQRDTESTEKRNTELEVK